ncbi:MAG: 50S ribosomal protein L16 [Candidatus Gracilibacteria bacterium]
MLLPKRQKYRKSHRMRGAFKRKAHKGDRLSFGSFGLKAQETGEISSRQIEAARKAMSRCIKRGGKIWIRIFPHKPITKKAAEVPMGSGKGMVEKYVALTKAGTIIFEMEGMDELTARKAMTLAKHKLPLKTKFITSHDLN